MTELQKSGITGEILLDAGTNELEVLVFRLGDRGFGVNVAKVREVIQPPEIIEVPNRHPSVMGLITLRGSTLTLIDLRSHLVISEASDLEDENRTVIVTDFNGIRIAFLVDKVERIHRISWEKVLPIPNISFNAQNDFSTMGCTTGSIDLDGRLVLMLDFESISDSILSQDKLHVESVENPDGVDRASKRVIFVEDSPFMRNQIQNILRNSGYEKLEVYSDGLAAWNAIEREDEAPIDAIVSDIEMPRMDGLHLTKLIKNSPRHKHIPVVLFSSLISEDNANKGVQVGANVQIPKPELPEMVRLIDRIVSGQSVDHTILGEISVQTAA